MTARTLELLDTSAADVWEFVKVDNLYEIETQDKSPHGILRLNVERTTTSGVPLQPNVEWSLIQINGTKLLCLKKMETGPERGEFYDSAFCFIFLDESGLVFKLRAAWLTRSHRSWRWLVRSRIIEFVDISS